MKTILEPEREIPVVHSGDICVLGGGCTGVFAAVRAARMGTDVVLVEKQNCFSGVATNGLVNVWHSLYNTLGEMQIIGGLTQEVIERLEMREAVSRYVVSNRVKDDRKHRPAAYRLNTEELKIELDELVTSAGIRPMLHTLYVAPVMEESRLHAIVVEGKSGRCAIEAKVFIDATGDADLVNHLGVECDVPELKQPPSPCAKIQGITSIDRKLLKELVYTHREEFGLREDWGWGGPIPDVDDVSFHAESHVFGVNCARANPCFSIWPHISEYAKRDMLVADIVSPVMMS